MVPDRKPRMRLLDDADLAPCLVNILTTAADRAIFDRTLGDERIARTVDSDAPTPPDDQRCVDVSVVLLRSVAEVA
jgi:hypothetical protein